MTRLLFVCLGNICRSPLAEAAFRYEAQRIGLEIEADSAGTGHWHVGNPPDHRSIAIAAEHGVDISGQRARQIAMEDFRNFDRIFAMDHSNLEDLIGYAPSDGTAKVSLLLDLIPGREGEAIDDPYYGGPDGFASTWADVCEAARYLAKGL